jgi:hypothetical protein
MLPMCPQHVLEVTPFMLKHERSLLQTLSYWKIAVQLQRSVEKRRSEVFRISYPSSTPRHTYLCFKANFTQPSSSSFIFLAMSCFLSPVLRKSPCCGLNPSETLWDFADQLLYRNLLAYNSSHFHNCLTTHQT